MDKTTAIPFTQPFHIDPPATQTTAAADVETTAITSVSTQKTMAKPAAKTNMQLIGNVSPPAIRLPTQRSPRKQTALTAFYAIQPLHIIQMNQKTHNSNKRNFQKLSSTLPTFQQQKASQTSTMSSPHSAKKRKCVQTQSLIVDVPKPSQWDYNQMATACDDITPEQMELAFGASLQFMGYTMPPVNDHNSEDDIDLTHTDEEASLDSQDEHRGKRRNRHRFESPKAERTQSNRTSASSSSKKARARTQKSPPTDEQALTPSKLARFTSVFAPGKNRWVTEENCQRILTKTYNFPLFPALVLRQDANTLRKLLKLAGTIIGYDLDSDELSALCNHEADSDTDPAARFKNARIRGIVAQDIGSYTSTPLHLHDILFGKQGALYENTKNHPPKNCVVIMKLKATLPNNPRAVIDHAIFLPDILMLITINTHIDVKDSEYKRVRNAWQIRSEMFDNICDAQHKTQAVAICNRRIAGRIFGGGDGTNAELIRAAVIYSKPDTTR